MQDRLDRLDDMKGLEELIGKKRGGPRQEEKEDDFEGSKFNQSLKKFVDKKRD